MTDIAGYGQGAQTQSRAARETVPLSERLGYSAAEFGSLFGRSATWVKDRFTLAG